MKPPHQHLRIDLAEQKAEIVKKLGLEGSKQYFYYLSKFVNLKLSKVEFNKHCIRIVGRENIPLHNQFVHSILKNACNSKAPPPKKAQKSLNKQSDHKLLKHGDSNNKLENGDLSQKQHHDNVSIQSPKKALEKSAFCAASSCSISGLLDNTVLRERMEKITSMQGLKGVTMDCASFLNKGLDSYLKSLISSGVKLVGSRLGSEPGQSYTNKHLNGVSHSDIAFCPVALLDFKVAMELNPQQLGEDWPLLMEKICAQAFSEK